MTTDTTIKTIDAVTFVSCKVLSVPTTGWLAKALAGEAIEYSIIIDGLADVMAGEKITRAQAKVRIAGKRRSSLNGALKSWDYVIKSGFNDVTNLAEGVTPHTAIHASDATADVSNDTLLLGAVLKGEFKPGKRVMITNLDVAETETFMRKKGEEGFRLILARSKTLSSEIFVVDAPVVTLKASDIGLNDEEV